MNESIFLYLNSFVGKYPILDITVYFCAEYLAYVVVGFLLTYYFYKILKTRLNKAIFKELAIILGSTFLVWGISQIINYFYFSPRPFVALENINILFEHGNGDSFPSGHATFFFTLAFISKRYVPLLLWGFFMDSAFLISLARIMSGVHWPYDIFGAMALAFAGVYIIREYLLKK